MTNDECLKRAVKLLFDIDQDHFENITRDCEKLPAELNPQYKYKVFNKFKEKVNNIFSKLTPPYIFSDNCIVTELLKIYELTEPIDSIKYLDQLYSNAQKITFIERWFTSNKADVIAFHHALQDVTVWVCRVWLEQKIREYIEKASTLEKMYKPYNIFLTLPRISAE